jgi:hypothetical protein
MSNGIQDKVLNAIIKIVTTIIAGTGAWQIRGGELYGQFLFTGYQQQLSLSIPTSQLIGADTYNAWSREILAGPARASPGVLGIIPIVALLALIAHVVYRQSLPEADQSGAAPRSVRGLYVRFYFWITLVLIAGGVISLFYVNDPFWLVASAALLIVPIAVYLVYNSRDLLGKQFAARFAYVCLAFLWLLTLAALPYLYGRRAFDLRLRPVISMPDREKVEGVFVFSEPDSILAEVTPHDTAFTIMLFKPRERFEAAKIDASLREWVRNYTPPPRTERAELLRGLSRILDTLAVR